MPLVWFYNLDCIIFLNYSLGSYQNFLSSKSVDLFFILC